MTKSTEVAANQKPHGVTGLGAPTRDGYTFSAKWTKPSTTKTDAHRATGQQRQWRKCILAKGEKGEKDPGKIGHRYRKVTEVKSLATSTTSSKVKIERKEYYPLKDKKGNRYPKLHKVMIRVRNTNSCATKGEWTNKEYVFSKPEKPSIEIDYDEPTNNVTIAVTGKPSDYNEKKERYDTIVNGNRTDTGDTGSDRTYQKSGGMDMLMETGEELDDRDFKGDSKTYHHRITNPQLPQGAKIHLKITAVNRGLMGDSDEATKHYIIRAPYIPQIKKIRVLMGSYELTGDATSAEKRRYLSAGNGRVLIDFGYANKVDTSDETAGHDTVRTKFTLERLISNEWQSQPAWASTASGWKSNIDTYEGATSDRLVGHAKATDWATIGEPSIDVVADMGDVMFGHHVWYRIKAERQGMAVYSEPVEAEAFKIPRPSLKNDESGFIYIANGVDGQTIDTVVGWDNPDNNNETYDDEEYRLRGEWTTIIGYSEYADATESNKQPEEVSIDWGSVGNYNEYAESDINPSSKIVRWNETAKCGIHGLSCGTPYYLWVKRHVEMDGLKESDKSSGWNPAPEEYFPFTPTDNPTSITVGTPLVFIPTAENALRVSWTHNATSAQKSWAIFALALPLGYSNQIGTNPTTGKAYMMAEKIPAKILMSGEGAADSVMIPYDALNSALTESSTVVDGTTMYYGSLENGDELYIGVGVSTGGAMILSYASAVGAFLGAQVVGVATKPDCAIWTQPTITEQPVRVLIFTNDSTANFTLAVTSRGASITYPDKVHDQADGDYVWSYSGSYSEWVETSTLTDLPPIASNYRYAVNLISDGTMEFLQNGTYDFLAHTVNSSTDLLISDPQVATASVEYIREAYPAGESSRCETRNNGGVNPYVEIYCAKPDNWIDTDHAIVYRITPDGAYAIATDVRFGTVVTDPYPPFSKVANTRYAITTVTNDGMVATREVPYGLKRHGLRFDWGDGETLELPYNIELSDDMDKDSEIRSHQDGTVNAYWNPAISRTLSANSVIIKDVNLYDAETFETVRHMGRYPGPVLVRAHNGICFTADVKVSGLSDSYESQISPVTVTCTEITLTDQFMAAGYYKYNEDTTTDTEDE